MIQKELEFIGKFWQSYLAGMGMTLLFSMIGVVFGTLLGLFISWLKLSNNKGLKGDRYNLCGSNKRYTAYGSVAYRILWAKKRTYKTQMPF